VFGHHLEKKDGSGQWVEKEKNLKASQWSLRIGYIDWYHTSSVLSLEVHKSNYRVWNSIIWDQTKTQKQKKFHENPTTFPKTLKKKDNFCPQKNNFLGRYKNWLHKNILPMSIYILHLHEFIVHTHWVYIYPGKINAKLRFMDN
jgi:hypothetical protein